jgi:hypothetical protein
MAQVNARSAVRYPTWQREYEAAALEDDPQKQHQLVCDARSAIAKRRQSLAIENGDSEWQAINNALTFLRLWEREHTHRMPTPF